MSWQRVPRLCSSDRRHHLATAFSFLCIPAIKYLQFSAIYAIVLNRYQSLLIEIISDCCQGIKTELNAGG